MKKNLKIRKIPLYEKIFTQNYPKSRINGRIEER